MSFHDKPEVLEQILSEHPEIEVVQIQFNYADYEDPTVQSRAVYQVCRKYGKPVIIMEPVKGGALANLPGAAGRILEQLHGGSQASYALRFAASFEGVAMVLSGMSSMEQMRENLDTMSSPQPLTAQEPGGAPARLHGIQEPGIHCMVPAAGIVKPAARCTSKSRTYSPHLMPKSRGQKI